MISFDSFPQIRCGVYKRNLTLEEFLNLTKIIARFYGVNKARTFFEKYARVVL